MRSNADKFGRKNTKDFFVYGPALSPRKGKPSKGAVKNWGSVCLLVCLFGKLKLMEEKVKTLKPLRFKGFFWSC
jgi:hypothetical protein